MNAHDSKPANAASESLYAARMFELVPSMIAYWDRDLCCRAANRAYEHWFGVSPEALVGRSIKELLGPRLFALNEPFIAGALRGEPQLFERIVPGPDGKDRHSLAHYLPDIVDSQVQGFVAYVIEVTPLKEAQAELQAAIDSLHQEATRRHSAEESLFDVEQSLALTLGSIGAGYIASDRQGCVTRMNDVAQRLLGWSEAEARGHVVWDVFVREDRPAENRRMNPVDVVLRDSVTIEDAHEVIVTARNGTRIALEVKAALTHETNGEVRGMVFVFRDLSELRRAQAERRRAEERFQRMVDAAPNALLMFDATLTIRLANRQAERLFGYTNAELLGQVVQNLLPERDRTQAESFFTEHARQDGESRRELVVRRKNGAERQIDVGLSPIDMPDGRNTLLAAVDVTERKRVENELKRSNQDLEQFAYVASHDLQAPLRIIVSFAELLRERYDGQLDDKAKTYLSFMVDGARRMQRLVRDLLAYAHVGSHVAPYASVALEPVVRRVLGLLEASMHESGATVDIGDLPLVSADENQLYLVFQNLISNALTFRDSETVPEIRIAAQRLDDRWCISVADNGIGIEAAHAERVFQMFQRLNDRSKYEGSGIGLAIVQRIVEQHGGRVWLESAPGVGSTFYFTLAPATPFTDEAMHTPNADASATAARAGAKP